MISKKTKFQLIIQKKTEIVVFLKLQFFLRENALGDSPYSSQRKKLFTALNLLLFLLNFVLEADIVQSLLLILICFLYCGLHFYRAA